MNKYDRLLYILNLLRSRRNLNARMIAEECGVTERSVYRDIIALSEANVPIYYDNGYKMASDNFLPPLNFDQDEYRCLKLALESTPLKEVGNYRDLLKRIKAKVDAGLSRTVRQNSRFGPRTTLIDISVSVDQRKVTDFFETLEEAVRISRRLSMRYDSISSGVTERIVEPYFVVFRGRAFYFVGLCLLRNQFRTFRVDRIISLKIMDEHFDRRPDIDAESYFEGSWQVYSGDPVEIVVKFCGSAARVVQSAQHHPGEQIERVDEGQIIYRVVSRGTAEIQRWILGFGKEAEVISPPQLRRELLALGVSLAAIYRSESP
ncbi:MAG: YafY family transcriptional regulator [candidate division Zixibacteria bacterium]|nr:YafY family transcriptional regulator [candidate division Zixibacteria bacterium]